MIKMPSSWTIAAIAVGLVMFVGHLLVDNWIGRLIDWAFAAVGLQSGKGPLVARVERRDTRLALTLENRGKHRLRLAGLQGRDGNDKLVFPTPYVDGAAARQPPKMVIESGESQTIFLDPRELATLDCRTLAVIDSNAHSWVVTGFVPTSLRGHGFDSI
jgi:hypothetical protein